MKEIAKYTFGMGDRFGRQGVAQLQALLDARAAGIPVCPVWNKSMREHTLIGTQPQSVRDEADAAVKELGYEGSYYVDADHINLKTVSGFLACSDFFTLDVADDLGHPPAQEETAARYRSALIELGAVTLQEGMAPIVFDDSGAAALVDVYGGAVAAAKALYENIAAARPDGEFVVEVSMDETNTTQGPKELLGILRLIALEGIPAQTIAPRFSGRFNKGVDYVGDTGLFREEFEADLLALRYATEHFGLPKNLKLSIHSGSDKFRIYSIVRELIQKHDAGLHLKTAGTTWLEEVAGLAEAGGEALEFMKKLYIKALGLYDELVAPYAPVLDIDRTKLPPAEAAAQWTSEELVAMVAHDQSCALYNANVRQLFHVAFKLAAKAGDEYLNLLDANAEIVNRRVHDNLLNKHCLNVFP